MKILFTGPCMSGKTTLSKILVYKYPNFKYFSNTYDYFKNINILPWEYEDYTTQLFYSSYFNSIYNTTTKNVISDRSLIDFYTITSMRSKTPRETLFAHLHNIDNDNELYNKIRNRAVYILVPPLKYGLIQEILRRDLNSDDEYVVDKVITRIWTSLLGTKFLVPREKVKDLDFKFIVDNFFIYSNMYYSFSKILADYLSVRVIEIPEGSTLEESKQFITELTMENDD